jgi:hypothetical protein
MTAPPSRLLSWPTQSSPRRDERSGPAHDERRPGYLGIEGRLVGEEDLVLSL